MRRPLAAVVINHRTPDLALAACRSLQASGRRPEWVIAVDNGSGEAAMRLPPASPAWDLLLTSSRNLGFSGGANLGIREALRLGAERVLLLNSDAVALPSTLEALEESLSSGAGAQIAGAALVSSSGESVESLGISFSRWTGRMRQLGAGRARSSVGPLCAEVEAVSAGAMLVERAVFNRIGLFSEDYFFSFEDLDFCLRARRAGFRVVSARAAWVEHAGSRSIGSSSPRRHYFATRNHLLLAHRQAPLPAPLAAARALSIVGLNALHAALRSQSRIGPGLAAVGRGAWDYSRGRLGDGSD